MSNVPTYKYQIWGRKIFLTEFQEPQIKGFLFQISRACHPLDWLYGPPNISPWLVTLSRGQFRSFYPTDNPKSQIFTQSPSRRMFFGAISRWITGGSHLCSLPGINTPDSSIEKCCAYQFIPSAICMAIPSRLNMDNRISGGNSRSLARRALKSPPEQ